MLVDTLGEEGGDILFCNAGGLAGSSQVELISSSFTAELLLLLLLSLRDDAIITSPSESCSLELLDVVSDSPAIK